MSSAAETTLSPFPSSHRAMTGAWIAVAMAIATLAVGVGVWLLREGADVMPGTRERPLTAQPVRVVAMQPMARELTHRYPAITRAVRRGTLSFTVGGRVVARPVDLGTRVEEGQTLARIDPEPLVNARDSAAASRLRIVAELEQRRSERDRRERLLRSGAASVEDFERLKSNVGVLEAALAVADARLEEAERMVRESDLRAPFAGVVTGVFLEPGEYAAPGARVVALSGDGAIEVEIGVPSAIASRLDVGGRVEVELPMSGLPTAGATVTKVALGTLGAGELFPVIVEFDDGTGVSAGMTAEVSFVLSDPPAPSVPVIAVVNPSGYQPYIFVAREGLARRVPVRVTGLFGERVTIDGEIAEGESVIVAGHASLLDSEPVLISP